MTNSLDCGEGHANNHAYSHTYSIQEELHTLALFQMVVYKQLVSNK